MGSLRLRVLVWVSGLLIVIFAVTIVGLDMAFRNTSRSALDDLLNAQLLGLIAVARPDPGSGLTLPEDLAESRFNMTDSGLYGALWNASDRLVWRSWSLLDTELDFGGMPDTLGERSPRDMLGPGGDRLKGLVMSISWEFDDGGARPYTFGVAASLAPYEARQRAFRWTLIGWFGGATVITLSALWFLLYWVWRPLRRLASEVVEIEQGDRSNLSGSYPTELSGLTTNLDTLIESERRRQTRYRNTLDNLAHSLKTPLAVMSSILAERWREDSKTSLDKEVERMRERVGYHLEQARVSGTTTLGLRPISIGPIVKDVKESLDKVYLDKGVHCSLTLSDDLEIQAEPGDMLELIGNLMDNAYKYCNQSVLVSVTAGNGSLSAVLEDDGPGWPSAHVERLTQRGLRVDEKEAGQGIGLAVVQELVSLYRGEIRFEPSSLGGGRVIVTLPI